MNIYELIDQIHLQHIENLDDNVNRALGSDDHDALFILGETLYQYGLVPQGLKVFEQLYLLYPDEQELLVYYIEGLVDENDLDKALTVLHQSPLTTERLLLEADLYQQQDMLEVALQKLRQAEELAPDDLIVSFALGELLYYDGEYLQAARRYEQLLSAGETHINRVNLTSRLADCMLQAGNYEDAESYYQSLNEEDMTSDDFFKKALALEKNDHLQDAVQELTTLIDKDPDYMQAYLVLVNLLEAERRYDEAILVGKKGLLINEFFKELMVDTARIMLRQKDTEGEQLLIQALTIDPSYTEASLLLADYYKEEEKFEEMIQLFSMIDEEEMDPVVKWTLAYSYQQLERYKEAQHFFEDVYPDLQENIDYLNEYYSYLLEIGQQADKVEQQLIKLDPNFEPYGH
ncbi:tetratricopeptide repeat protein [Macrococcus brunensis]|uniref:Tetratricopeptide repeat protein n=1 Tax=Macrococcus brunensis TaxID=198483 RepID=A0A4R6BDI2_9STAP|nr:tetratricopeptide repeat protein [Macrococcus brunensis]TDL97814.1 tetratricopeptide repeat protein [Macrococcus brunensis]ULG71022.1 tetratricopeptide repeat protein [Macrococcus brunensis]ULG73359.1 tetratricopeptide repeat protein [Macrococcus brunensis]